MMITIELMNSCRREPETCMLCRLAKKALLVLRSMTKVEWVMKTIEEEKEEE